MEDILQLKLALVRAQWWTNFGTLLCDKSQDFGAYFLVFKGEGSGGNIRDGNDVVHQTISRKLA